MTRITIFPVFFSRNSQEFILGVRYRTKAAVALQSAAIS